MYELPYPFFADDSSSSGSSGDSWISPSADGPEAKAAEQEEPSGSEAGDEPRLIPLPGASRRPSHRPRWWEEARARRWLLGGVLGLLLLILLLTVLIPLLRNAALVASGAGSGTVTPQSAAFRASDQSLLLTASADRLYAFSSKGVLSAVQAHDGRLLWRYTLPVAASQFLPSQPLVANGVVYVSGSCFAAAPGVTPSASRACIPGSGIGTIVAAVRASDGHLLWQRVEEGRFFATTLLGGKLYLVHALTSASLVEALEAQTGRVLWQRRLFGSLSGVLMGDQVVVALPLGTQKQSGTQLLALRPDDGQPLWSQVLPGSLRPVLEEQGRVYLATDAQGASASLPETLLSTLESRSGTQRWQRIIPGQLISLLLSRDGSRLYALTALEKTVPGNTYGSDVTLLLALDDRNGQLLWQRPVNQALSLAILVREQDGLFYLALERQDQPQAQLMALSVSNGQPLWQQQYFGEELVGAQPRDATLYVAVSGNAVLAFDLTNGELRWRTRFSDHLSDIALTSANRLQLYVSTASGQLAALDSSSGRLRWSLSLAQ
ncbi:PQQ-binding-like beta-propeller repeat protein [Thermogemmatispora sp.]|uniref:outer membrane protein assembly factor BamB family protein n=1 Tax=Thermogemmatispora sp. TaxID=1968838 RepID=UPI001D591508|nr:PQQ-binding-like beta-propeller repeat protein [Thermogemmatispora sp.]MBX5451681.1 PQQ-binding-like beta-propeller repeat protein [Thermogemmatispora sp.]